jgi:glycosyltransferase involved in cell wall biosynthesis
VLEGTVHPNHLANVLRQEYQRLRLPPVGLNRKWQKRLTAEIAAADAVITQSQFAARSYVRHGVDPSKVQVVPLGVDLDTFSPAQKALQRSGSLKVLYVGRLSVRKGVPCLLKAMELVDQSSIQLTMIGVLDEELTGYCNERLAKLGGRVRWIPGLARRDLVDHYRNADVAVLPSLCDSFGQSVLEAMGCGTPSIVSDACGAPVTDGQEGIVLPAGDPAALAGALDVLASRPDVVRRLGGAAAKTALSFGWDRFRNEIIEVLRSITKKAVRS